MRGDAIWWSASLSCRSRRGNLPSATSTQAAHLDDRNNAADYCTRPLSNPRTSLGRSGHEPSNSQAHRCGFAVQRHLDPRRPDCSHPIGTVVHAGRGAGSSERCRSKPTRDRLCASRARSRPSPCPKPTARQLGDPSLVVGAGELGGLGIGELAEASTEASTVEGSCATGRFRPVMSASVEFGRAGLPLALLLQVAD